LNHQLNFKIISILKDNFLLKLDPIFAFPAHIGCIKTVSVGGKFLASGSTDEVIK